MADDSRVRALVDDSRVSRHFRRRVHELDRLLCADIAHAQKVFDLLWLAYLSQHMALAGAAGPERRPPTTGSFVLRAASTLQRSARRYLIRQRQVRAAVVLQRARRRKRPFVFVERVRRQCSLLASLALLSILTVDVPLANWRVLMSRLTHMPLLFLLDIEHRQGPGAVDTRALFLRGFVITALMHQALFLMKLPGSAVSAIHEVRQLSQYYCERHIYLAVLIGVAPCPPRWVLGFLTVFSAIALVTAIVSPWLLGEGATAWLLSGPVVIAMVGWSTHLVSAAAIRHTTEREGTLGDLRKMLDATHSACASCAANRPGKDGKPAGKPALGKAVSPQAGAVTDLVDSASIARAWTEGPIVWIYAGLLSVGAAYFVVSFIRGRLMPSSRAYAGEELEKYIQHPFTGVFLGAASALPIAICCGVSRKRTYAFARGLYAMNMLTHVAHLWRKLNEIRFLLETWPEPEDDLAAMSSPAGAFMSGMLAVLMPRSRAELILNVSLVAAKHLGSSVSRALRMRFDEVLIGDVVQHISMAGLGVATTYIAIHGALAASWQRERMAEQLEIARRQQLHARAVPELRKAIASEAAAHPLPAHPPAPIAAPPWPQYAAHAAGPQGSAAWTQAMWASVYHAPHNQPHNSGYPHLQAQGNVQPHYQAPGNGQPHHPAPGSGQLHPLIISMMTLQSLRYHQLHTILSQLRMLAATSAANVSHTHAGPKGSAPFSLPNTPPLPRRRWTAPPQRSPPLKPPPPRSSLVQAASSSGSALQG